MARDLLRQLAAIDNSPAALHDGGADGSAAAASRSSLNSARSRSRHQPHRPSPQRQPHQSRRSPASEIQLVAEVERARRNLAENKAAGVGRPVVHRLEQALFSAEAALERADKRAARSPELQAQIDEEDRRQAEKAATPQAPAEPGTKYVLPSFVTAPHAKPAATEQTAPISFADLAHLTREEFEQRVRVQRTGKDSRVWITGDGDNDKVLIPGVTGRKVAIDRAYEYARKRAGVGAQESPRSADEPNPFDEAAEKLEIDPYSAYAGDEDPGALLAPKSSLLEQREL